MRRVDSTNRVGLQESSRETRRVALSQPCRDEQRVYPVCAFLLLFVISVFTRALARRDWSIVPCVANGRNVAVRGFTRLTFNVDALQSNSRSTWTTQKAPIRFERDKEDAYFLTEIRNTYLRWIAGRSRCYLAFNAKQMTEARFQNAYEHCSKLQASCHGESSAHRFAGISLLRMEASRVSGDLVEINFRWVEHFCQRQRESWATFIQRVTFVRVL